MSATLSADLSLTHAPVGESVRVAVAIQHVPSRAALLPRLLGQLADGWHGDPLVIEGDESLRDPWDTYLSCLDVSYEEGREATHLLIVQDDALLVEGFGARLRAAVALRPADVLCAYTPIQPAFMGRAVRIAHDAGRSFAQLPSSMFTPLVCTSFPIMDARDLLLWWDSQPSQQSRSDDALVARWMRSRLRFAQAIVPCLADHDEEVPSVMKHRKYSRGAAVLA